MTGISTFSPAIGSQYATGYPSWVFTFFPPSTRLRLVRLYSLEAYFFTCYLKKKHMQDLINNFMYISPMCFLLLFVLLLLCSLSQSRYFYSSETVVGFFHRNIFLVFYQISHISVQHQVTGTALQWLGMFYPTSLVSFLGNNTSDSSLSRCKAVLSCRVVCSYQGNVWSESS